MGNIKTFLNIGFVVLCLFMLWYLFSNNTTGKTIRDDNRENRKTFLEEDFRGNNYGDNTYGSNRSQDPLNNPYEELDEVREENNRSGGGIFNRNRNDEYNDRKAREREAELERLRAEETQAYNPPKNYNQYNNSENPYDRQDTYVPPSERRNQSTTPRTTSRTNSSTPRYGTKRFSRDNQLGTYKGPLLNGQPHGFGFIEYDNKDIYVGEYRYGQRHGFGNSIYRRGKSGQVKLRQYSKGQQVESSPVNSVSYGNMRFVNGGSKGTYYGPLKNQEPHGFGYFKYDNGNVYIGAYKNGKRHGSGNMVYADKSITAMKYDYGRQLN